MSREQYKKKVAEFKFEVTIPADNTLPICVVSIEKHPYREECLTRNGIKHCDTDVATAIRHYVEEYCLTKKKH